MEDIPGWHEVEEAPKKKRSAAVKLRINPLLAAWQETVGRYYNTFVPPTERDVRLVFWHNKLGLGPDEVRNVIQRALCIVDVDERYTEYRRGEGSAFLGYADAFEVVAEAGQDAGDTITAPRTWQDVVKEMQRRYGLDCLSHRHALWPEMMRRMFAAVRLLEGPWWGDVPDEWIAGFFLRLRVTDWRNAPLDEIARRAVDYISSRDDPWAWITTAPQACGAIIPVQVVQAGTYSGLGMPDLIAVCHARRGTLAPRYLLWKQHIRPENCVRVADYGPLFGCQLTKYFCRDLCKDEDQWVQWTRESTSDLWDLQ